MALKLRKLPPYILLITQELADIDTDRQIKFCKMTSQIIEDLQEILVLVTSLNVYANKQNCLY